MKFVLRGVKQILFINFNKKTILRVTVYYNWQASSAHEIYGRYSIGDKHSFRTDVSHKHETRTRI